MNEAEIAAVIVGLTEMVKKFGLPSQYCPLIAVVIGIAVVVGEEVKNGGQDYYSAVFRGLLIGLTSTGLYATTDKMVTKGANANTTQETY